MYTDPNFHVVDDRTADYLLRKLGNIDAEKRRVQAQTEEIVRQLDAAAAHLNGLYLEELEEYARARLASSGSRRRFLTLIQGTLAFRPVAPILCISDCTAALQWAKDFAPHLVIVSEELDAEAFCNIANQTRNKVGELLPGVEITAAREEFCVYFGKVE